MFYRGTLCWLSIISVCHRCLLLNPHNCQIWCVSGCSHVHRWGHLFQFYTCAFGGAKRDTIEWNTPLLWIKTKGRTFKSCSIPKENGLKSTVISFKDANYSCTAIWKQLRFIKRTTVRWIVSTLSLHAEKERRCCSRLIPSVRSDVRSAS